MTQQCKKFLKVKLPWEGAQILKKNLSICLNDRMMTPVSLPFHTCMNE